MGDVERVKNWMKQSGIQLNSLAQKMNMPYLSVYMMLVKRKSITNNFRWRFAQVFGWEVASELFEESHDDSSDDVTLIDQMPIAS